MRCAFLHCSILISDAFPCPPPLTHCADVQPEANVSTALPPTSDDPVRPPATQPKSPPLPSHSASPTTTATSVVSQPLTSGSLVAYGDDSDSDMDS